MTLEVRQLVLKSTVSDDEDEDDEDEDEDTAGKRKKKKKAGGCGGAEGDDCEDREQLKEEILAECRTWMLVHLQQLRER
jgi:hypothetical protein